VHRSNMAVATVATVALMMAWVVPSIIADLRKVCINTSMRDDLMTLIGVGPKMAENIIAYRQQNGPFQKPEEIMKVKGVGMRLYEINQEDIVIDTL
jgi:competence protein ComEA